jgi:hypothetical protein
MGAREWEQDCLFSILLPPFFYPQFRSSGDITAPAGTQKLQGNRSQEGDMGKYSAPTL